MGAGLDTLGLKDDEEDELLPVLLLGVFSEGELLHERRLYVLDIKAQLEDDALLFSLLAFFPFFCCNEGAVT